MYVAKIVNNGTSIAASFGVTAGPNETIYLTLGQEASFAYNETTKAITALRVDAAALAATTLNVGGTGAGGVVSIELGNLAQGGYFNKVW